MLGQNWRLTCLNLARDNSIMTQWGPERRGPRNLACSSWHLASSEVGMRLRCFLKKIGYIQGGIASLSSLPRALLL